MPGVSGRPFLLLLVATLASFIGYAALLPVVPLWAVSGGAGELGAGTTTGVFMATTVATQFAVPATAERIGYRYALLLGTLLLGVPAVVLPLTADLVPVLVISALRGVGFGLITVCGSALVALLAPAQRLGRASGLYGLAVGLPALLAVPAATWLVDAIGFGWVFAAATVLPVLAALPTLFLPAVFVPGSTSDGVTSDGATTGPALGDRVRAVGMPLALMLCGASGFGAAVTFLPLATGGSAASLALFTLTAGAVLGRLAAGRIGDAIGHSGRQLPVGTGITGLGLAGIAAGIGIDIDVAQIAGAFLVGTGFGMVQNDSLVLMFDRVGRENAGFASAAWNIGYDGGTGLGAVLLGAIVSATGYPAGFGVIAVAAALLIPVAVVSGRRARNLVSWQRS